MATGKKIKQLTTRTSALLTDYLYTVAGDQDYNVQWSTIKTLLGLDDLEDWQTDTLSYNSTSYIDTLVDSTVHAVAKVEYLAKRGSRTYRSGQITIMYDSSQVVSNDYWDVTSSDNDDLGMTITARLNGSNLQMKFVVDGSDTTDIVFNWKIISKKPITVS
jgi:hypothetical protein